MKKYVVSEIPGKSMFLSLWIHSSYHYRWKYNRRVWMGWVGSISPGENLVFESSSLTGEAVTRPLILYSGLNGWISTYESRLTPHMYVDECMCVGCICMCVHAYMLMCVCVCSVCVYVCGLCVCVCVALWTCAWICACTHECVCVCARVRARTSALPYLSHLPQRFHREVHHAHHHISHT